MLNTILLCWLFVLSARARLLPYDTNSGIPVFPFKPNRLSSPYTDNNSPFLGVKYHSGYINVARDGGEMFYWYFPYKNGTSDSNVPFIVWLTGGPGCSSELAALTENGPLTIHPDGSLSLNKYSWTQAADVVYIDQPLGTGFSVVGDPRNYVMDEKAIAADMREFLVKFLDLYPTLLNKQFFLTGESYAGHYIPSVAHALISDPVPGLKFVGIAVGNGWVDPQSQYPAYAEYAFENNMIGEAPYQLASQALEYCVQLIKNGIWPLALVQCNTIVHSILGKKNPYDIRLQCDIPPMCYNTTALDAFMNENIVQTELGVHRPWTECSPVVYGLLLGDWETEMRTKVGDILDSGIRVLVYNGDKDFICNWRGGEAWVNNISWKLSEEFKSSSFSVWKFNGKPAGAVKSAGLLTFLRVFDAGHMVPMDAPEVAFAMISQFLSSVPFKTADVKINDAASVDFDIKSIAQEALIVIS